MNRYFVRPADTSDCDDSPERGFDWEIVDRLTGGTIEQRIPTRRQARARCKTWNNVETDHEVRP